jgi:cytochrome c oxidase subunit 2
VEPMTPERSRPSPAPAARPGPDRVGVRPRGSGGRPGGRSLTGALSLATIFALALGATGCGSAFGLPDSATSEGDDVMRLWRIIVVLAALVTLLIWSLTAAVVVTSVRRRRRDGRDAIPAQHQYRTGIEIAYTAAPLFLVMGILALTFAATTRLTNTSARPDLTVDVIGFQWQWQFRYPDRRVQVNGDAVTLPELWLPVGRTVRFNASSPDVIHSFWVPDFLEKRDMIPGAANVVEVTVKEPGQWMGRCAEYCGFDHWRMKFAVCAVAPADFDAWEAQMATRPQPVVAGVRSDGSGPAEASPECPSRPTRDTGFASRGTP